MCGKGCYKAHFSKMLHANLRVVEETRSGQNPNESYQHNGAKRVRGVRGPNYFAFIIFPNYHITEGCFETPLKGPEILDSEGCVALLGQMLWTLFFVVMWSSVWTISTCVWIIWFGGVLDALKPVKRDWKQWLWMGMTWGCPCVINFVFGIGETKGYSQAHADNRQEWNKSGQTTELDV